jgi:hypothetical protein
MPDSDGEFVTTRPYRDASASDRYPVGGPPRGAA